MLEYADILKIRSKSLLYPDVLIKVRQRKCGAAFGPSNNEFGNVIKKFCYRTLSLSIYDPKGLTSREVLHFFPASVIVCSFLFGCKL